jgi:DNA-binding GntR family transcriptional regulator
VPWYTSGGILTVATRTEQSPQLSTPVPPDASMAERAYLELRDRIVSLRIPPGALVREDEVMKDLKMSRTPVREALLRLTQEHLVTVIPRRGTFVTEVHVGDVGRIYEFRRELEVVAAGWAAERRTEADLEEIDKLIADLREHNAVPTAEVDARSQIISDQSAHNLVYRLSGNPLIEDTLASYYFLAARIWFLASGRVEMEEPFIGLIELLEAIKAQDAEAARRHAREHSEAAEAAIRSAL